ncbi:unnamed protein product, partial [Mesorhabditis belari]|uniref:Uncharacterized protein n=1 Tax=Mesorhabditis belari TaxID=2138241 RepID=A0AAF3EC18_9BILA
MNRLLILLVFLVPLMTAISLKFDVKKLVKGLLNEVDAEKFDQFANKWKKDYGNTGEVLKRAKIWKKNKDDIEKENKKNRGYTLVENFFTDLDDDEKAKHTMKAHFVTDVIEGIKEGLPPRRNLTKPPRNTRTKRETLPETWYEGAVEDWRWYGLVPPVKDQRECNSCFSFAPMATIEVPLNWASNSGASNVLSEQDGLDCAGAGDCEGGGYMHKIYQYSMSAGNADSSLYPYTESDGTCQTQITRRNLIKDYKRLTTVQQMEDAIYWNGPITGAIRVPSSLHSAGTGIFYPDQTTCDATVTSGHTMAIVGYGTENGIDYWIIRNSWGPDWAEGGYFRMRKGVDNCGIETRGVYVPVMI